jgi:hypothetical protein
LQFSSALAFFWNLDRAKPGRLERTKQGQQTVSAGLAYAKPVHRQGHGAVLRSKKMSNVMLNTIINILDRYNISPEREGQEQQADGSIVYRDDAGIRWAFKGVRYLTIPTMFKSVWTLYLDAKGVWRVDSKLEDLEAAVEFAHEMANKIIEELEFQNLLTEEIES